MNAPASVVTGPMLVLDARSEVAALQKVVASLRRSLQAERNGEAPDRSRVLAAVAAAHAGAAATEAELAGLRDAARRRKDEISSWKRWYAGLSPVDAADVRARLARLDAEIAWRAAEIAALEARIGRLLPRLAADLGTVAQRQAQLAAIEVGVLDLPWREDPRLVAAERALEQARGRLDVAQSEARRAADGRTRGSARFEIETSRDKKLFFNLKASNGRVILTSGRHPRSAAVMTAIEDVRRSASDGGIEHRRSRRGEPYFVVTSPTGAVIARSEMYSTQRAMENGVASVEAGAPAATVRDLT